MWFLHPKIAGLSRPSSSSSPSLSRFTTKRHRPAATATSVRRRLRRHRSTAAQASETMSTKIRVIVSSFGRPVMESLPAHTGRVGLPETRKLYTVLRSPHIDKKSREQFEIRTQKHILDIKAERHELRHKLFWLKRHRIIGGQFEVQVFSKTRLDPKLLPLPQVKP